MPAVLKNNNVEGKHVMKVGTVSAYRFLEIAIYSLIPKLTAPAKRLQISPMTFTVITVLILAGLLATLGFAAGATISAEAIWLMLVLFLTLFVVMLMMGRKPEDNLHRNRRGTP
jgi:uncharacterized membrane protein YtjA (UPF0391 family)